MTLVRRQFRPEFLNRLDEIVMFNPLGLQQLRHIVTMNMQLISSRLQDRDIQLQFFDTSAIDFVLQQSYDPIYGARPLRRYLERNLVTMISCGIFAGDIPNHSKVTVMADPVYNKLVFQVTGRTKAHECHLRRTWPSSRDMVH